jgi:hypothetical protein
MVASVTLFTSFQKLFDRFLLETPKSFVKTKLAIHFLIKNFLQCRFTTKVGMPQLREMLNRKPIKFELLHKA